MSNLEDQITKADMRKTIEQALITFRASGGTVQRIEKFETKEMVQRANRRSFYAQSGERKKPSKIHLRESK